MDEYSDNFLLRDTGLTLGEPQHCSAGSGAAWIAAAWRSFKFAWLEFLLAFIVFMLITMALSFVPFGSLALLFLMPLLAAGYLQMAHMARLQEEPGVGDLFVAFGQAARDRLGRLLLFGLVPLVFQMMVGVVMFVAMFQLFGGLEGLMAMMQATRPEDVALQLHVDGFFFFWMLLLLVAMLVYIALVWFAVPLLWFSEMDVMSALRLSLRACLRNIGSLTVYSLLLTLLLLLAMLPFMLGLLVVCPLMMIAQYESFRQIFVTQEVLAEKTQQQVIS